MIRTGILTDDDPVELLEGWLVPKMPRNPSHRVTTGLLRKVLEGKTPPGWYVDTQEPITLADSEPEPDVVVVRGETRKYLDRHPGPPDLGLVIEVADTTLQRDRTSKLRLYALASIGVYWIVNLTERRIEVYTQPSGPADQPGYRQRQDYGPEDEVPLVVEGRQLGTLAVSDVLP
jgi:Uma2 family endonuclease